MSTFRKLDQIRAHLQLDQPRAVKLVMAPSAEPATGKRVQKNLSILEHDAERLKALAERDGVSQAVLLGRALAAYQRNTSDSSG